MKLFLVGIIATVLSVPISVAQARDDFDVKAQFESASVITKFNKESIEYKFKSLEEFNEGFDQITDELDLNNPEKKDNDTCEVTIEVKLEFIAGVKTIMMSSSVSSPCINALPTARKLKSRLIAAITG